MCNPGSSQVHTLPIYIHFFGGGGVAVLVHMEKNEKQYVTGRIQNEVAKQKGADPSAKVVCTSLHDNIGPTFMELKGFERGIMVL